MSATNRTVDVADMLAELLAEEQAGLVSFLTHADPYVGNSAQGLRRTLREMMETGKQQQEELAQMVVERARMPRFAGISSEHQYLAYLTIEYLLPKLVEAKRLSVARYEYAARGAESADRQVAVVLTRHLEQHRQDLASLIWHHEQRAGK